MRYVTAGESHGPALTAIVEGVPAGLRISEKSINADLARRQSGYGRGGRQTIETDTVQVTAGVRFGRTIGSPVALVVKNRDYEQNWRGRMDPFGEQPADLVREVTPRPGHADLLGALKTDTDDCRNILERASARHTAARVAASGIAREFLAELGVEVFSYVKSIGTVEMPEDDPFIQAANYKPLDIESSEVRCPDPATSEAMCAEIKRTRLAKDTIGGTYRVVVTGLLPGVGGYATPTDRLASRLAGALMSMPAQKGVEFGMGFDMTRHLGSEVHDPIVLDGHGGFTRTSNNAGGLEGGMTTGLPLVITVAMKPIATLMQPLKTVNLDTLEEADASKERSDVCAVPAAGVIAEGEVAFVLAEAYMEQFGRDNMTDIKANIEAYKARLASYTAR